MKKLQNMVELTYLGHHILYPYQFLSYHRFLNYFVYIAIVVKLDILNVANNLSQVMFKKIYNFT